MRLLALVVLVLVALAIYFVARAYQARYLRRWEADFRTLPSGETIVFIRKGGNRIDYSCIAPLENYENKGKNELERRVDIEIAMDDAEAWTKTRNKK